LAHHLPYPPDSGGRRRCYELVRRIGEPCDVHLIAVSKTLGRDLEYSDAMAEFCEAVEVYGAEPSPPGSAPPQVARHRAPAATRAAARCLSRGGFDLVHIEGFYMHQHLTRSEPGIPIVLVEQNVEFALWLQRAGIAHDPRERRRYRALAAWTNAHELATWRRSTALAALTEEDARTIQQRVGREVVVLPNGADHLQPFRDLRRVPGERPPTIAMVANYGYDPNVDAALWLGREIFPKVGNLVPEARLELVGGRPPPELRDLGRNPQIEITGRVPDVRPYLAAATVVACPLRIGGGIKVKMVEALAAAKPIVTTPIGAQGLGPAAGEAMRIAADEDAFALEIVELLRSLGERKRLSEAARELVATLPSWDQAADQLLALYRRAIREARRKPPVTFRRAPA